MNRIVMAGLAVASWSACLSAPAGAQALVNGQDPETVRTLFRSWGYTPTEFRTVNGQPLFDASADGFNFVVAFNGCTANRNCPYLIFIANYDDVTNPPPEWLNQQNYHYDMVTASRREDDGRLSLRTGITLGPEGIPESTLRLAVDGWIEDTGVVARSAIDAGITSD